VDVANSLNGDAAALAWGSGNKFKALHEFQCPNATDLADNIIKDDNQLVAEGLHVYGVQKISDYGITQDYIGVDGVGVGIATVNQFSKLGMTVQSLQGGSDETAIPKIREDASNMDSPLKPLYKFANKRAQMWFQLRIDLQNVDFRIDILDMALLNALAEQLTMVRYKVTDGHIIIEKKESIKERTGGKSPNLADAFVYWNWVRKKRHGQYVGEMPVAYGNGEPTNTTVTGSDEPEEFREPDESDFSGMPKIWRPGTNEIS